MFQDVAVQSESMPDWLPEPTRHYIAHVQFGHTLRQLARGAGCAPSTVLRQVRAVEARRDDPLLDEALDSLSARHRAPSAAQGIRPDAPPAPTISAGLSANGGDSMKSQGAGATRKAETGAATVSDTAADATINREARRILRRLAESGARLAVAKGMPIGAVLRKGAGGQEIRTATVPRDIAHQFVLRDWIACSHRGRVSLYEITSVGRAALKRLLAEDVAARAGHVPGDTVHAEQHRVWQDRVICEDDGRRRRYRTNIAETPVAMLARKRGRDGKPFLSVEMVDAAERLREDFELAQMGPRVTQNWDRFLTAGRDGGFGPSDCMAHGSEAARSRVARALAELGPGLGDVVLRVCCFMEGLEAAERRLGWSARSGKIVLRIALTRLARHYADQAGSNLIAWPKLETKGAHGCWH